MFKNINNYRNKIILLSVMWALLLIAVFTWSVLTGQYPLTLKGLLSGDTMSIMVFKRLRLPRAIMGIIGGFGLSISGYVYQMIFKNPLASPDVVGVSSGASAGAAFAIVAVSSLTPVVSISAFAGGIIALIITLLVAYLVPGRNSYTIVLAGIASAQLIDVGPQLHISRIDIIHRSAVGIAGILAVQAGLEQVDLHIADGEGVVRGLRIGEVREGAADDKRRDEHDCDGSHKNGFLLHM